MEYADTKWGHCLFEAQYALEKTDTIRIISGGAQLNNIQKLYDETGFKPEQEGRKKHML